MTPVVACSNPDYVAALGYTGTVRLMTPEQLHASSASPFTPGEDMRAGISGRLCNQAQPKTKCALKNLSGTTSCFNAN